MIGEDSDLEKSGRILNRVIEWNFDGITIEADQRHVREILKGMELERANRSATPCALERKDEGKGESRHGQGRTNLRWQTTTTTPTAKHSQMVTSHGTEHSWHAGMLCDGKADDARHGTRQEDRTIPRARCWFRWQQSGEPEAYSDADWGGDKATRRSVSTGSS